MPSPEVIEWMKTCPESIQAVMRWFPPLCKVQAANNVQVMVPRPGQIGTVVSYVENGNVTIVLEGSTLRHEVPTWCLKIVEFNEEDGEVHDGQWVRKVQK